jgi:hypothetical protein
MRGADLDRQPTGRSDFDQTRPATLGLELAKELNIKPMTAHQRNLRVVPARIGSAGARREAVREASNVVKTSTSIDFVRSVRGR